LRLLIIEDHALVREALAQVFLGLDETVRVETAGSCPRALEILHSHTAFDLILLDLALPGIDGFGCLKLLRQYFPQIAVVILSAFCSVTVVERAFAEGAAGFIPKSYGGEELVHAVRQVLAGNTFRPDMRMLVSNDGMPNFSASNGTSLRDLGLTRRQGEILRLIAQGQPNREIAKTLGLAEGTVKVHLSSIFKTLGVSSRTQALAELNKRSVVL
jgi:DNA-binding NarL/FixJ family response regulator